MIRFSLLGPVELVHEDGTSIESVLAQPKRVAILAYLALANLGGFVRRDTLLAMFWPESDKAHARGSLNQAIYFLRRSLGEEVIISRGDQEVGLDLEHIAVDVFELGSAAERWDAEGAPGRARGELMEGFHADASVEFAHWLDARRAETRDRRGTPSANVPVPSFPARTPPSPAGRPRRSSRFAVTAVAVVATAALLSAVALRSGRRDPAPELDERRLLGNPAEDPDERVRIAVLPCLQIPDAGEDDFLALGIPDQVITELTRSTELRPTALTSVLRYRGAQGDLQRIGEDLTVRSILQCTIVRDESRVRITFQLIDAETETQLWSEPHIAALADLMDPGSTIGRRVAESLDAEFGRVRQREGASSQARNEEAWFDYLRGRQLTTGAERDLEAAITYFERAIHADPSFAAAHAGLARALTQLGIMGLRAPEEVRDSARSTAERALSLDPDLGEGHAVLALIRGRFDWNWEAAEEAFRIAYDLQPASTTVLGSYGLFLITRGRREEGIELLSESLRLDPLNPFRHAALGFGYFLSGDYSTAVGQLRRAQRRFPDATGPTLMLAWNYAAMENYRDALAAARAVKPRLQDDPTLKTSLAFIAAVAGDRTSAEEALRDLQAMQQRRYVDPANFARLLVALGDTARALDMLEAAHRRGSPDLVFLRLDIPFSTPFSTTARGAEILRKLKFPVD